MVNLKMESILYNQPAEWAQHESCWMAWPSHAELWEENLEPAQEEFTNLCKWIADVDPKTLAVHGDRLNILIPTEKALSQAQKALIGLPVTFHKISFGDIWLRDTAPIFVTNLSTGLQTPLCFKFNGWGNKYSLPGDTEVATNIARTLKTKFENSSLVLEGGSIETDGEGTFLTTEQCLLNSNRNPHLNKSQIEEQLKILGAKKIIWLKDGLLNDHTDGHIDTIARFVAPGKVVCMLANDNQDPNSEVLQKIYNDLKSSKDFHGKSLEVITIPSPGLVLDDENEIMPASYVNFYISNSTVVVPTYGTSNDNFAVSALQKLFPTRKVIGSSAKFILSGGGAFHCITQQQPK